MIRENLRRGPAARGWIVSGRLDLIEHAAGQFRLLIGDGSLQGRLDRAHLDVERLRRLWGKHVTVQGIVHFRSDGRPRLIEARRIVPRAERDGIFEILPTAEIDGSLTGEPPESDGCASDSKSPAPPRQQIDPMSLWGTWPGDEPIEELLAELD